MPLGASNGSRLLQAGRLGELGKTADGYCNLTFNDDLADAVMAALTVPEVAGKLSISLILIRELGTSTSYASGVRSARLCDGLRGFRYVWRRPFLPRLFQIAKIVGQRIGMRPGFIPEPILLSLLALWRQQMHLDCRKADAALAIARSPPQRGPIQSAKWFRSAALN
jgi:hypothetical protein